MSLDTEEDIAKWIEERKRKWPGAKNKELKLQRDLKRKAYDAASPAAANTQQQQVNKRGKFAKPNTPAQHPEGYQRAPRVWGQTQASTEEQTSSTVPSPAGDAPSPDDDEDAAVVAAQLTKVVAVNNDNHCAPGAEEESIIKGKEVDRNLDREIISNDRLATEIPAKPAGVAEMEDESDNDSAPEEIETAKQQREDSAVVEQEEVADQPSVRPTQEARPRPDCTAWITGGQCKFGKQCRYSHDPLKRGKPRREPPPPASKNPFERGDLIGKLVHHEVRHEVSDLTQVIDFLARNDWLKNVELYPGHKKDLEERINEVA